MPQISKLLFFMCVWRGGAAEKFVLRNSMHEEISDAPEISDPYMGPFINSYARNEDLNSPPSKGLKLVPGDASWEWKFNDKNTEFNDEHWAWEVVAKPEENPGKNDAASKEVEKGEEEEGKEKKPLSCDPLVKMDEDLISCHAYSYYSSGLTNPAPNGCYCHSWSYKCPFTTCSGGAYGLCLTENVKSLGFISFSKMSLPLDGSNLPHKSFLHHPPVVSECVYWLEKSANPTMAPIPLDKAKITYSKERFNFMSPSYDECIKAANSLQDQAYTGLNLLVALGVVKGSPGGGAPVGAPVPAPPGSGGGDVSLFSLSGGSGGEGKLKDVSILYMVCGNMDRVFSPGLEVMIEGLKKDVDEVAEKARKPDFCFTGINAVKFCMLPLSGGAPAPAPAMASALAPAGAPPPSPPPPAS